MPQDGFDDFGTPHRGGGLMTPRGRSRDLDEVSNASPAREDAMAEAIQAQSKALIGAVQAMQTIVEKQGKDKKLSSTIRVNPTIQWPKLGDDGPERREVGEFFEAFEETVGLANDGAGMSDKERLKVLALCLKGSRQKTYENLFRKHRALGEVETEPGKVFDIIKAKLLRFSETTMEKQMRVLSEWENLSKGKVSALAFEPQWEQALAELESVGLARTDRELTLNYLTKICDLGRMATADSLVAVLRHGKNAMWCALSWNP